ncbi:MAG TPA: Ku protein [Anaeromyxobacteraceae bacterium]|nr:Ku protein [Anaeromyxobacteraceae bacterium]
MPPRPVASGTISFGLVSIPVKLYPATQPSAGVSFRLLHAKDGSRLEQQYVCAQDGVKVARDEMVKGYEFQKDRYVTFTAEELKALDEVASQTIEIAEFVPASRVDPVYFDKPYFVGPDKGGAKAYRLLAEALSRSGKAALGRYAARGKQYLVLIRPAEGRLVMQQLLYPYEVRSFAEVPVDEAELKEPEVQLALQLVEQTSTDEFHPERYEDGVRTRVLAAIERKIAGQEIALSPPEKPHAQVIDLMEALKASLAAPPARPTPAAPSPEPGEGLTLSPVLRASGEEQGEPWSRHSPLPRASGGEGQGEGARAATGAPRKPPKRAAREASAREVRGKGGRRA